MYIFTYIRNMECSGVLHHFPFLGKFLKKLKLGVVHLILPKLHHLFPICHKIYLSNNLIIL